MNFWRLSSSIFCISGRRCSTSPEAIKKTVLGQGVINELQNTVQHQKFRVGAAVGFGLGLLFFLRERYLSTPAILKRSGDYFGLIEYWRERGRDTKAFRLLEKVAQDDPRALVELGHAYGAGSGTEMNPAKAYQCYLEASEKGESPFSLAVALQEGNGCDKFPEKAFELFVTAALQGDKKACLMLNKLYKDDNPLGLSRLRSLYYARLAGQRGSIEGEREFNRYCLDAGTVFLNTELDEISEQIGTAELNAISKIISRTTEKRLTEESRLDEIQEQVAELQPKEVVEEECASGPVKEDR